MELTVRREQRGRNRRRGRCRSLGLMTTVAVFVAASCTGDDAATTPDRPPIESTQLDTGTATAEVMVGDTSREVSARRFGEIPHVGRVDDELFVAVARPPGGADDDLVVYLCDGDEPAVWLRGEVPAEGGSVTGGDVTVEIAFAGGGVAGDVSMAGDHRGSFAAGEAIDDAGLYRASATIDGDEVTGAWIVLDDGSQRGRFWWSEEEEEELQM